MKKTLAATMVLMAGAALAATTFSGRLLLKPDWSHKKTQGQSTLEETFDTFLAWTHASGTNANQMATIVSREGTLTNSASITYDLTNIDNGFGDNVDFAVVRFMAFGCETGTIEVGGAASDAFVNWVGSATDTIKVRPDGIALFVAPDLTGYAVGTAGNLKILNTTTNTITYTMYIGGSE